MVYAVNGIIGARGVCGMHLFGKFTTIPYKIGLIKLEYFTPS